jgi:hypothetical protein
MDSIEHDADLGLGFRVVLQDKRIFHCAAMIRSHGSQVGGGGLDRWKQASKCASAQPPPRAHTDIRRACPCLSLQENRVSWRDSTHLELCCLQWVQVDRGRAPTAVSLLPALRMSLPSAVPRQRSPRHLRRGPRRAWGRMGTRRERLRLQGSG